MSYTKRDAEIEFSSIIDETLQTRDVERAYMCSHILEDMGDYEEAARFNRLARQWEREDNMPEHD